MSAFGPLLLADDNSIVAHILDQTGEKDLAPQGFWQTMSYELFSNVWELYEAIDMFFALRSSEDGFPAMLVRVEQPARQI